MDAFGDVRTGINGGKLRPMFFGVHVFSDGAKNAS